MTILSLSAKRNIRNAALSALHYIAYESECEVSDILVLLTEPPRADAPVAQTAPLPTVQSSQAGVDAVASPATDLNAPDEQAVAGEGSPAPDPAFHSPETADENAPGLAHAGEGPTSPAPNPDADPPPERPGASDASLPSDEAGEVPPTKHGASPAPIRKRDLVVQCAAEHPDWTHQQIADHLGLSRGSVSGNLAIARRIAEKSPQEPAGAVLTPSGWKDAPEPAEAVPEQPFATHSASSMPYRHARGHVAQVASARTKFVRLKETVSGRYLGNTIVGADGELVLLKRDRETLPYLWRGTRDQLKAVRKKFPETHALHVVALEDQTRPQP